MTIFTEKDSETSAVQTLNPDTYTADNDGQDATVDLQNFGSALIVACVGESGDTLSGSVKIELEVEESDDDTTFTDVADADLTTVVSGTNTGTYAVIDDAAEDDAVYVTSYKGSSRYIGTPVNLTGTHTNGTPIGIAVLRMDPKTKPASAN